MKKAIIYATKSGTCQDIAQTLAKNLTNVDVFDIKKETPDLANYDMVIFGGGYYASMLVGKLKKFIKKNKDVIKQKKYAFFISCMESQNYIDVLKRNVGEDLVKGAVDIKWLGYGASIEKSKGFNRFIVKILISSLKKQNKPVTVINQDDIVAMAKKLEEIS